MSRFKLAFVCTLVSSAALVHSIAQADDFVPPPPAERAAVAALAAKGIRVRVDGEYRVVAILLDTGTDEDLKHLAACEKLFGLDLISPQITDAGLEHLKGLANLTAVNVFTSGITDEGLADWRKARPNLRINDNRPRTTRTAAPFGTFGSQSPASLATNPAVQDDLKLTPEQRQQIRAAGDIAAFLRARDEKVNALLTAEQKSRLKQIELQQSGAIALDREEIAKELNLSAEQRSAVRTATRESSARFTPFRGGPGAQPPPSREEAERLFKERDEKILSVLDDEQRKVWLAMQGPKAPVSTSAFGFRGTPFTPPAPADTARSVFVRINANGVDNISAEEFAAIPESVRERMKDAGVELEFPSPRESFERVYAKYLEESRARLPQRQ
jgi:hypothetical protein